MKNQLLPPFLITVLPLLFVVVVVVVVDFLVAERPFRKRDWPSATTKAAARSSSTKPAL